MSDYTVHVYMIFLMTELHAAAVRVRDRPGSSRFRSRSIARAIGNRQICACRGRDVYRPSFRHLRIRSRRADVYYRHRAARHARARNFMMEVHSS